MRRGETNPLEKRFALDAIQNECKCTKPHKNRSTPARHTFPVGMFDLKAGDNPTLCHSLGHTGWCHLHSTFRNHSDRTAFIKCGRASKLVPWPPVPHTKWTSSSGDIQISNLGARGGHYFL